MTTPEPPLVETVSKRSPFGALLSRTLPNYGGPFPVGVCDVELPVPRRKFGTFTHRQLPGSEAGLSMDTVLFSIFYPAEPRSSNQRVVWFPK
jgi:platelet-activating factor acetylhydrolase